MKTETLHNIVDFVNMASISEGPFCYELDLGNGTVLVISRNPMTGAQGRFYATLPVVDGVEDYGRAEDWQTLADVADRIAVLAE